MKLLFLSHFLLETITFRNTVVVSLTLTSALLRLTMLLLWLAGVSILTLNKNTGLSGTHGAQAGVKMATSAWLQLQVDPVFARFRVSVLLSTLLEHTFTLFLNICIREDAERAILWE